MMSSLKIPVFPHRQQRGTRSERTNIATKATENICKAPMKGIELKKTAGRSVSELTTRQGLDMVGVREMNE